MIVSFAWPSSHHRTGGVVAMYEFANGLARRGHEVHFIHGPAWPNRIDRLDELTWFSFHPGVQHHIVDDFTDPALPSGDVVFLDFAPPRLGLPCLFIQGARMLPEETERAAFRLRGPKVCIASWLIELGARYGVPAEQLWHVPMGIDHALFSNRTATADRRFDVALHYNSHPTKDWGVGLQALRTAREQLPGLRTVVFGHALPPEPLGDGVEFMDYPRHRQLADEVYNQSRIFVQSSFREGFGFTAVEAMACGAALVTTDNGGSRDYAIPDETAWVVPPRDAAGLAAGVVTLLKSDVRRQVMARAGTEHVRRFDWDRGAAILSAHLEEYIADPRRFQEEPRDGEPSLWE